MYGAIPDMEFIDFFQDSGCSLYKRCVVQYRIFKYIVYEYIISERNKSGRSADKTKHVPSKVNHRENAQFHTEDGAYQCLFNRKDFAKWW